MIIENDLQRFIFIYSRRTGLRRNRAFVASAHPLVYDVNRRSLFFESLQNVPQISTDFYAQEMCSWLCGDYKYRVCSRLFCEPQNGVGSVGLLKDAFKSFGSGLPSLQRFLGGALYSHEFSVQKDRQRISKYILRH